MSLSCTDIVAGYEGPAVLDGVSLTIEPGEVTGILGPNGSGKSTLLKVLGRLLRPRSGSVSLQGRALRSIPGRELARRMAVLPQTPIVPLGATVAELVGLGRYPHVAWARRTGTSDREAIDRAIDLCDLGALRDRVVTTLSGGERQRGWIAMCLAQEPEIVLLDEPISALDVHHQLEVLDLVGRLSRERKLTVVVVLHDLNLAARHCGRLVALSDGRIVADGTDREVIAGPLLRSVFKVNSRVATDPVTGRASCTLYRMDEAEGA